MLLCALPTRPSRSRTDTRLGNTYVCADTQSPSQDACSAFTRRCHTAFQGRLTIHAPLDTVRKSQLLHIPGLDVSVSASLWSFAFPCSRVP